MWDIKSKNNKNNSYKGLYYNFYWPRSTDVVNVRGSCTDKSVSMINYYARLYNQIIF